MAKQCNSRSVLGKIDLNVLSTLEATNEVNDIDKEVNTHVSQKNLTNEQRQAIFESLLKRSVNGQLKKNTTYKVAQLFRVSMRTVQRIWQRGKENEGLDSNTNVSSKKALNCGRKRLQIDVNQFRHIPLRRRTTLRYLSVATNLSVTTLFRQLKEGFIRHHSNAIKPLLKVENMKARIRFCLSMIEQGNNPNCLRFVTMENIIHVDEKWFYMTKQLEKYYLLPDEDESLCTCKSKTFITKVMFMAVLTHPRFDESGNELFSGKIRIFPFINKEPARRSNKNRSAGTMETKTINSINKEIYRSYIVEKLLLAIRDKWLRIDARSPIFIQQDNAKPHIGLDDEYFQSNATKDGFDIRLICQPPNSLDMNVLDLGFLNVIQALIPTGAQLCRCAHRVCSKVI
ncbi:uncharacterized protein LOC116121366 [Pistacia vera]|uniref:uncharacterized protein LOC116121366 n=1 Tax=Pistacia vera TaxID=55513 RepID=UPI001263D7C9|nr:uncharacterized protein LOC116121366 [Pistacia vera]